MIDISSAKAVLKKNDRGGHTVPTAGLYPFQWSWDSAITALGWLKIDEARAWREAETMFAGQWPNGMLPHILFHGDASSYFPGPDVWGSGTPVPSSAISQPPVWATAIRMLYERSKDRRLARSALDRLLPKLVAYHLWWYRERDQNRSGLVLSYHPWESGMDNSPAWDEPLASVPEIDWAYQRRDLEHVDADERPHKPQYDRYLYLVDFYKHNHFDSEFLYLECPYRVQDIGIIAILQRASEDLLALCREAGYMDEVERLQVELARTRDAVDALWSEAERCFFCHDVVADARLEQLTTAGLLPLFGHLATEQQASKLAALIDEWLRATPFGLASTHPASDRYEPQRYWRGPVWLHINWMIALGLDDYGYTELAQDLRERSIRCVETAGFYESFNAETGAGCGGGDFSWTAAIALHWLAD